MIENPKFTIITATICREDLKRCIASIDNQDYENWQHIIVVDGEDKYREEVFKHALPQNKGKRLIITLPKGYNNVGNTPRYVASYFVTGDYIMYLDEDDYHINNTFKNLAEGLNKLDYEPSWGYFKALRFGGEFFNDPPGHSMTTNNQFFHKPIIDGKNIRYTTRNAYCGDGELIEELKILADAAKIDTEKPLVCIDVSHHAERD